MNLDPQAAALLREAADWRLIGLLFECPGESVNAQVAALGAETADPVLQTAAAQARQEASEGLYHSTFGPGGPAPPREASYQDTIQLGYLMSELSCYYEAFSYRPQTEEAQDHVAVEAGFLSYLRLKQAYALAAGDAEAAAITADAARRFIEDHLSLVAEPLAASLVHSGVSYLAEAGKALLSRTGPRRVLPVILNPVDEDCEMTCGG